MLKFTAEQEAAINTARSQFNQSQTALEAAAARTMMGNASPVPLDAWRRVDTRASMIQRDVLAVFNTLAAANTTPLSLGDLVSYFPKVSDTGEVNISMDGRNQAGRDAANVTYEGTPVPIIDSVAAFGWRQMEVMRKSGLALDVETIATHQRKVAERMEDMAINGLSSIVVGGATIYGLRTFPNRNTDTHGLTLASSTGAQWLTAVGKAISKLEADNSFGRATLFVNWGDWSYASRTDYATNYPKTIIERMLEIGTVERIVPCGRVPANEILAVNNLGSGEWGSILSAMPLVTRPRARINTEDDYVFSVMAAVAPQFRSDYSGNSHIAHITAA
jgi:uncharacterized linocin/CFP29 family protein